MNGKNDKQTGKVALRRWNASCLADPVRRRLALNENGLAQVLVEASSATLRTWAGQPAARSHALESPDFRRRSLSSSARGGREPGVGLRLLHISSRASPQMDHRRSEMEQCGHLACQGGDRAIDTCACRRPLPTPSPLLQPQSSHPSTPLDPSHCLPPTRCGLMREPPPYPRRPGGAPADSRAHTLHVTDLALKEPLCTVSLYQTFWDYRYAEVGRRTVRKSSTGQGKRRRRLLPAPTPGYPIRPSLMTRDKTNERSS